MQVRRSARVIAIDEEGCVLLFLAVDPQDSLPPCWITPGGGVEEGEELRDAASRELFEESGYRVRPEDLIGPVAISEGEWEFRGQPLYSIDTHFALRVQNFDPFLHNNLDEIELEILTEHRWWHPDELDGCTDQIFPLELAPLVRDLYAGVALTEPRVLPW